VSRLATFSGVRVAQSLLFCLMVGRLLVGSCGLIFRFLCHDWWTFSEVGVAQSFVFCVMVGRLLVGFVWLNLFFCIMVGRLLVGFVWLNL
jgi:putative flippase GtrA